MQPTQLIHQNHTHRFLPTQSPLHPSLIPRPLVHKPTFEEALLFTAAFRPQALHFIVRVHTDMQDRKRILVAAGRCADAPPTTDAHSVQARAGKVFRAIFEHALSITKSDFEIEKMDLYEAFAIATFVETTLKNMPFQSDGFFLPKQTMLTRAIQYNFSSKTAAVIADFELAKLSASGSFKETHSALILSSNPNTKARYGVHSLTHKSCSRESLMMIRQELVNLASLRAVKGVVRVESWTECDLDGIRHISTICEGLEMSLEAYFKNPQLFTLRHKIHITYDLIVALRDMHERRIIHGDIRPENIVCTLHPDGSATAKFIDLGFSCDFSKKQPLPFIFNDGYYGSIWNTAPELFGCAKQKWQEVQYYQFDVFALGMVLYSLFIKLPFESKEMSHFTPQWHHILDTAYKAFDKKAKTYPNLTEFLENQKQVKAQIAAFMEQGEKVLAESGCDSQEGKIWSTIYAMLHLEPAKRLTLKKAADTLQSCS